MLSRMGIHWRRVPRGFERIKDIEYGKGADSILRMDMYRPVVLPADPLPAVLYFPGGAWEKCSKETGLPVLRPLLHAGYICFTVNYRVTSDALFPAQLEDCKCAVRYVRAHAESLGIDSSRIGVCGVSAGGHLAAFLGVTAGEKDLEGNGGWPDQSSRVQAVCDWYGPTNLESMPFQKRGMDHDGADSPEGKLIGGVVSEKSEEAKQASPVNFVSGDEPPFFIVHGTRDMFVPVDQTRELFELLQKTGVPSELHIIEGAGHDRIPAYFRRKEGLAERMVAFFDVHLKGD